MISPGDLMVYGGDLFADWRGDALAAGHPTYFIGFSSRPEPGYRNGW